MASYPPPSFFSSVFDTNAFAHGNDNAGLTEAEANLLYYKYPVGQPFQTLQQTDHTGLATFNAGIDIQTGTLTFPDNTVQTTAFTGSGGAGSLSATLVVGNSAGATDINMNNNDITNCATINTVEFDRGNNALQTTSINIGENNLVSTANSSGYNVAIGSGCLSNPSFSGESNIAFGTSTLQGLSTGSFNLGIGSVVGTNITTGSHNVAIGYQANQQMTSGSYCLAIGDLAGSDGSGAGNIATSSTAIGRNAKWTGSNQIVLGTASETVYHKGNSQNEGLTTMLNNLSMGSTTAIANRQISSSYYNFYATNNVGSLTYSGRLYGNLNSIVYDCPDTSSTGSSSHIFYCYNGATALASLSISNLSMTSNIIQPASNDSSTKIPTTAWVQSAISASGGAGSLSATLLVGNSAGATDINMNNNDITNCATVSGLQVSSRLTNINIGSGNQNLTSTGNGYNIAIGNTIMPLITTAKNNNMVGSSSGSGLIDGQGNNGLGSNALNAVSSGDFNVAIGNNTGKFLTTGSYNVFLGSQAGQDNVSGSSNVCVGNGAGQTDTGSNNTCIGESTSIGGGVSNSTAIGQGATTSTANTIQLGKNTQNVNCPNTLSVAGTITNTATQPASNDSSTKVPTTAWVQGAITAGLPASINQMWSWNAFNITGALPGGAIRTASLVLPYSSAITFSTSCRIEFNYAIFSNSATTQTVIPNLLSAYTGQSGGTNVNPNTFSQVDLVFNPTTQTMNSFICQSTFANIFTNTTTKYWRGNSAYNFVPIKFAQTAPITLNSPSAGFMTINLDVGFPAINYSSNPNYLGNLCSISTSIRITASQATTTDTIGKTAYSSGVAYFL